MRDIIIATMLVTILYRDAIGDRRGSGVHVQGGGEWEPYPVTQSEVPSARATEESVRIRSALHDQIRNRWYNITIVSQPDRLALRGEVDTERTRQELLRVAQAVSQRQVQDELALRPAIPDQEIRDTITRTLEQEYPKLAKELQVEVDNGQAKLHGDVANHRQIDAVLASVLMLEGVKDVESDVKVRGRPYPRRVDKR